jgi:uncharacterized Zn-binding protein involved in type VI secretion
MPGAARATLDKTLGQVHTWTPVVTLRGSPNVIVNDYQAVRVGDPFDTHYFIINGVPAPPVDPHDSVAAQGSQTVFVNGLAMSRVGDQTSCSDTIATGSSDVIVG